MPFTLAHPAVVIFSKNKNFNLLGLILGSMAPDFIYFLLFNPSSNLGHTILGFVILNLPICFLLNYLILKFIKNPFIINLPSKICNYYTYLINYDFNFKSTKDIFVFTYSCIVGMLTHIIWDAFTHKTGYFVVNINILKESIHILGYQVPFFKLLQHGSTLLGFFVILYYFYTIRRYSNKYIRSNKFQYHLTAISIQILIIILSYLIFKNFGIGRFVVTFINGLFLGYLTSSIIYRYKLLK
ncbi:MAG: DUF4184 family protein [Paraclostridium bifermentans]|uniref:DUF4184 family protein n=1 Tax=Paraclostridium bifermentans TaxID=1490 RepID=UPI0011DE361B|nr:DUF4184 family protein [Paraclostridium bifermentans]MBS6508131.1 DUF4184 family protein [Paraclostridium bifermentans]MDU3802963.1 DUF4184 family protein [Paraclostridium bifermentans]